MSFIIKRRNYVPKNGSAEIQDQGANKDGTKKRRRIIYKKILRHIIDSITEDE